MTLPTAYIDTALSSPPPGVLPPAYGSTDAGGSLLPAYGDSAALALNFSGNYAFDPRITFTRASNASYFDSTGTLQTAGSGVARSNAYQDHDPVTLEPLGFLIEETRTNSIRNNTMQGAVVGTPGTSPTNWVTSAVAGNISGREIVGVGTENGITYIDYRYTFSGAATAVVQVEAATQIVASTGQTWANSVYVKLVGGSLTNMQCRFITAEATAAGAFLVATTTNFTPTDAALNTQRVTAARTLTDGTTGRVYGSIFMVASGAADITLRIGLPQLELGAFATSPILTFGAAATRLADSASITGTAFTAFWNQSEGTFVSERALGRGANGGNQFTARASDNTYNNSVGLNTDSGGYAKMSTASGGVFDGTTPNPPVTSNNTFYRHAAAYKTNDLALSQDEAAALTDSSATIPTALTRLDIGADHAGLNDVEQMWLKSLTYYRKRLPNQTLVSLTA